MTDAALPTSPADGNLTPDLDIETLRLLVAVAEDGSMTAAARRRGISQPAASARIREFEARWRLGVLHRSTRGSTLSTDGEAVVAWARSVLHAAETMRAGLHALSEGRRSEVTVAASLTVAEHLVPRWLAEFHAIRPSVRPVLRVVNSEAVVDAVRDGSADLGFVETTRVPRDVSRRTVGRDRLAIVVAPAHSWARRRSALTRDELLEASWVLREDGSGTRGTFEAALGARPRVGLEGSSTAAIVGAAAAGFGPAVVSRLAITELLALRTLVEVPHSLDLRRPLTAVWRSDVRLSESARDLLTVAVQSLQRPGTDD
jgi:DNA-binding transcriptional LysR family regulator